MTKQRLYILPQKIPYSIAYHDRNPWCQRKNGTKLIFKEFIGIYGKKQKIRRMFRRSNFRRIEKIVQSSTPSLNCQTNHKGLSVYLWKTLLCSCVVLHGTSAWRKGVWFGLWQNSVYIFFHKKFLTPLSTTIEIHEQSMSKKKWDEIDFQIVHRYVWKETEN